MSGVSECGGDEVAGLPRPFAASGGCGGMRGAVGITITVTITITITIRITITITTTITIRITITFNISLCKIKAWIAFTANSRKLLLNRLSITLAKIPGTGTSGQSVGGPVGRSVNRAVGRSVGRSVGRKEERRKLRSCKRNTSRSDQTGK